MARIRKPWGSTLSCGGGAADAPAVAQDAEECDTVRAAISVWLSRGATASRRALEPLTPAQRRLFIETLRAYEAAVAEDDESAAVAE
ncbi:hypothetical protein ABT173_29000 [Streptomyces sp. NPDC001795]|uniref:hypothetical protein n=1 Tax=unclassified Streptomyces TaxID=2593676 RepID=UPI003329D352